MHTHIIVNDGCFHFLQHHQGHLKFSKVASKTSNFTTGQDCGCNMRRHARLATPIDAHGHLEPKSSTTHYLEMLDIGSPKALQRPVPFTLMEACAILAREELIALEPL